MKFKKKPTKSRKVRRKEERIAKKAKKNEFFKTKKERAQKLLNQSAGSKLVDSSNKGTSKGNKRKDVTADKIPTKKAQVQSIQDDILKEIRQEGKEKRKLERQMKLNRIQQLKKDNEFEDADIKRLEKQLKINKRSDKSVANFFATDGLDYLLEACDRKKLKESVKAKSNFEGDDSDFDGDLAQVTGKKLKRSKDVPEEVPSKKKRIVKESPDEDSASSEEENASDSESEENLESDANSSDVDESDQEDISHEDADSIVSDAKNEDESDKDNDIGLASDEGAKGSDEKVEKGLWEDIYGRTRDKEGNVVSAYKPPQMRDEIAAGSDAEKLIRLKKQLKGLLNRLAENNMVSIASQIEELYMANSRNDMNETLWILLKESLLSDIASPERLVAEHAMLLAVLGANVGGEVVAYVLQKSVSSWHQRWMDKPAVENKETNNILLLLCYMFHFKIFHCTLLYDILQQLIDKLNEKEVELVLLVLRTVGFSLRKEDSVRLKEFVVRVQTLANDTSTASEGSRAGFMLDTVLAIKNNNMSKIPNYNPEYADRLKKSLKVGIRKGNYNAELKVTLDDLLKADERGRWWVVGSAWTGVLPGEKQELPKEDKKKPQEGFSSKLLELAKKQRMNTDARRVVFCSLMSAEDYIDAFEKLMKLGLKGPNEREIMNVILHCLLSEKVFNPYYAHLAKRFCTCDRRFQIMLQFALWDKIKELKSLTSTQVSNLAKFLSDVIIDKSLPISVLKIVQFAELDKPSVRFIRQVLLGILMTGSADDVMAVFARIALSKSLKLFREGLRLFLHHFVLKNSKHIEDDDITLLTERVNLADSALSATDKSWAL